MSFISKTLSKVLYALPYKTLVKNYHRLVKTKLADIVNEVTYNRFFKESELVNDFDNYVRKLDVGGKYCIINKGIFEYKILNFCFIKDMMSNIIWCLENGYKPIINIYPKGGCYSDNGNLWDKMLKQPFGEDYETVVKQKNYIKCPINSFAVHIIVSDIKDEKKVLFWNKMFKTFAVFNEGTQKYFDDEYEIIRNKKVLGCVGRGTDYIGTKNHPIQPSIDELIEKAGEVFNSGNFDYIYLATEEKKIADAFKEKFPNKILENKRNYFDEKYFSNNKINMISGIHFDRENDDYLKMLEYMSSINLVSKCDSLVAGLCGGSEIAIYWNGLKYRECYCFKKGVY